MSKKYKEPHSLTDVAEFHRTFDLPCLSTPAIPHEDRCKLRVSLLQEELNELKAAIEEHDIIEVADALADLQYVLSGAILEFGLASQFKSLFEEVHRSNMSKTCKNMEEAIRTQKHYESEKGTESYIVERDGEYLVYRRSDAKVLKSIKYSPADLAAVLSKAEKK